MIFSFGGASAIGKTTLCNFFSDTHFIIPEVNLLFEKEKREGKFWYYEKQVERYQMAKSASKDSIFDGDIFQPVWYNWIYGYPKEFPSQAATNSFYLEKIRERKIGFPDLYIIFFTTENELRKRKEQDATRRRRNFEKHLLLIEPHLKYIEFLKNETAIPIELVEYKGIEETKEKVNLLMNTAQPSVIDVAKEFKRISNWLASNQPTGLVK